MTLRERRSHAHLNADVSDQMKYRLSDDYIRWRRNAPRRIIFGNFIFAGIVAGFVFLQQGWQSPHLVVIAIILGLMFLLFLGITTFQIRAARRQLENAHLDKVYFEFGEHGLTFDDTTVNQTMKYDLITSVILFRSRNGQALRGLLKTRNGKELWIHVANIEAFIAELKTQIGTVQYREKRLWREQASSPT